MDKVKIFVNDKEYEVEPEKTLLNTLRKLGYEIPTLCHLDGIVSPGACRMCVVEVEGARNLQASCVATVRDGMKVYTNSKKVNSSRRMNVELLMANHPDCLSCAANRHCKLQELAENFGIYDRKFAQTKNLEIDDSAPAYYRDNTKCILCERCVEICEKTQDVSTLNFIGRGHDVKIGNAFDIPVSESPCIQCGQCVLHCPVGALVEKSEIDMVLDEINDPERFVVVQTAPSIRAALGEEFGLSSGTLVTDKMAASLRRIGFDKILDTSLGADMTIMEEGYELLERIKKFLSNESVVLPQFTSCCPGWVKYVEHKNPKLIPNLSTAKSPHQMFGAVIKGFYSKKFNVPVEKITTVSIMPCTAKKYEARREELRNDGYANIDYVLTTRELGRMIKRSGIDFVNLPSEDFDDLGTGTGAGDIFGVTGGVMEAALRTAYEVYTGNKLERLEFDQIRGLEGVKEGSIEMNGTEIKFAVASGTANSAKLIEESLNGTSPYHFIEIMACPGGCINGGGQPKHPLSHKKHWEIVAKRMGAIYKSDKDKSIRRCHENPNVTLLYKEFLGKPLSEKAEKYMHTSFTDRSLKIGK